jgi:hypothetical protein
MSNSPGNDSGFDDSSSHNAGDTNQSGAGDDVWIVDVDNNDVVVAQ